MSIRFRPSLICGASLAVLAAMPATGAETAADMSASTFMESVTVTAQKRIQNPIDVPMALTAYSGDFLKKIDVQEFDKLSLFVPGFVVQNQSPNNPGFGLRGLNLDSGEAAQEPRVSVFEDDVSISTTRATYIELFDIERVEIAKGPQTTLFGRAALMGGINVIQNKAKLDGFAAGATAEAGENAYLMADGFINVPLSDTVAVRVAGRYKTRDGYVADLNGAKNYNSVDTMAGRVALTWKPSEAFSADFIANYEEDKPSGTSFKSGTFLPTDANGTAVGDLGHSSGATLTQSIPGFEDGKNIGLERTVWDVKALTTTKFNSALSLNTVTAYRRFDSLEVFDPDGFYKPLLQAAEDERGDQFSHEMRLNYDDGGRFSAFGGISYFYSNVSQRVPLQFDERMAVALLGGSPTFALLNNMPSTIFTGPQAAFGGYTFSQAVGPSVLQGVVYNTVYSAVYKQALAGGMSDAVASAYATTQAGTAQSTYASAYMGAATALKPNHWEQATNYGKTKSVDLYADATYRLTDALELDAGVRYTHDDKVTSYASTIADSSSLGAVMHVAFTPASLSPLTFKYADGFGVMTQPTVNNGDKINNSFSDDGLSWRLAVRYALEKDTSVYVTYARGRRPKVLSLKSPSLPLGAPEANYAPAEEVNSYEAGLKTLALDGKLRFDTSAYFYTYSNFQSNKLDPATNAFVSFNAGKAEAWGIENTADWSLTDWADLFATYTYNRARFTGDSAYHGNHFRLNPDHKLSIGASLRQAFFGGTLNLVPTYTWQSKIFFDDNNDIVGRQDTLIPDTHQDEYQDAYGLLNLRLTYELADSRWSVSGFVTNVLNQKFIKDAGNSGDNLGIPTFISGEPRFFGGSISFKTR